MENEFVPYELALAMKELGFDVNCLAAYVHTTNSEYNIGIRGCGALWFDVDGLYSNSNTEMIICSAPLNQQAFRWFREKHNIDCYIEKDRKNRYWFYITVNTLINKSSEFCYHRYEKAELSCLEKLIEIVVD